ncbi:MAG TPA: hypothetical protein VF923_09900 [Gemmatimonadales bacterium]
MKPFLMAGVYYGPRQDRTSFKEAVRIAREAQAELLASPVQRGLEAERSSREADAAERIARAEAALEVASIKRAPHVPPEAWQAQKPRLRALLLRGKFVLQTPDGVKVARRGSRARRADVLATSR